MANEVAVVGGCSVCTCNCNPFPLVYCSIWLPSPGKASYRLFNNYRFGLSVPVALAFDQAPSQCHTHTGWHLRLFPLYLFAVQCLMLFGCFFLLLLSHTVHYKVQLANNLLGLSKYLFALWQFKVWKMFQPKRAMSVLIKQPFLNFSLPCNALWGIITQKGH